MFTKSMLKKAINQAPCNSRCYAVIGGVAHEIQAVVSSSTLGEGQGESRLWFLAGKVAEHIPPVEVHQPRFWLNSSHKVREVE